MTIDDPDGLEAAIYEAAVVPEKWSGVLERITALTGARGGVFFGVSSVSTSWIASPGLHDDMVDFVASGWAAKNTRMEVGLKNGLHLMPRFVTEADYYPSDGLEREALYKEFFYARGLGHSAGTIALLPHEDMLCFSFERQFERGPFEPGELAQLDAVRPHLMRASLITARLGMEKIRTAIETLSAMGLPAAAVSRQGKVIEANDQFAAAGHIWTTRGAGRLALIDPAADAMLQDGLAALGIAPIKRSVPIRADTGAMVAVVHIVPLHRLALDIFGNTAALVVLSEPHQGSNDAALLISLFDLTPAEIDVARAIAAGLTVNVIARSKNRSAATIRNQLKSAMEKTGSARQIDLALLLRSLAAPGG